MASTGTIVISRDRDPSFSARGFNIRIDGVRAGRIRVGGVVELPVQPGLHRVQITVDWYASEPLDLDVHDGRRIELEAGIGAFSDSFFRPRRYLRLEFVS
jgi:hypothetical protein